MAPPRRSAGMLGTPGNKSARLEKALPAQDASADPRREAFRAFMIAHHLAPSQWAQKAGVPPREILAYLTGRTSALAPEVIQKLAAAANVEAQALFTAKQNGGPAKDRHFVKHKPI